MGNRVVTIDSDEENFRVGLKLLDEKMAEFIKTEPFIVHKQILSLSEIQTRFALLEFSFNDIKSSEKQFEELLNGFWGFYSKYSDSEQSLNITVTGYHSDTIILFMEKILKKLSPKFVFVKEKQILSTVLGIYLLSQLSKKNFLYKYDNSKPLTKITELKEIKTMLSTTYFPNEELNYPYVLVNIKGGLSFYKVDDHKTCKRLGGSIIGESTCVNLIKFFTKNKNIMEAFEFVLKKGDSRNIDMTVKDIYGEGISKVLDPDIIACSFGKGSKINSKINYDLQGTLSADIARSVFIMMAVNVAQLTVLYAQLERIQRVIFVSSLLKNETFFAMIQSAMQFFANPEMEARFVDNVEFLPCLGNLLTP